MQYVEWLNAFHFPTLSSAADSVYLETLLKSISCLTLVEFCLLNRQITGEDPQEATLHLDLKCSQRPILIWGEWVVS